MKLTIRIPRSLYEWVKADLERPHAFAGERVGFLAAKLGNVAGEERFILFYDYKPVADEDYVRDRKVAARINSHAIQQVLQWGLDTKDTVFHVHAHRGCGRPLPSRTDRAEIPELIPSFRGVSPKGMHGIMILSEDSLSAWAWFPGKDQAVQIQDISVVGYPVKLIRG